MSKFFRILLLVFSTVEFAMAGALSGGGADLTARAAANTKAAKGANSDITSLSGLTTPLSVTQGGTGATTGAQAWANIGGQSLIGGVSGYQKFPSGLIIQWGVVNSNGGTAYTTFPVVFPNRCASVSITAIGLVNSPASFAGGSCSQVAVAIQDTAVGRQSYYIAIGY